MSKMKRDKKKRSSLLCFSSRYIVGIRLNSGNNILLLFWTARLDKPLICLGMCTMSSLHVPQNITISLPKLSQVTSPGTRTSRQWENGETGLARLTSF